MAAKQLNDILRLQDSLSSLEQGRMQLDMNLVGNSQTAFQGPPSAKSPSPRTSPSLTDGPAEVAASLYRELALSSKRRATAGLHAGKKRDLRKCGGRGRANGRANGGRRRRDVLVSSSSAPLPQLAPIQGTQSPSRARGQPQTHRGSPSTRKGPTHPTRQPSQKRVTKIKPGKDSARDRHDALHEDSPPVSPSKSLLLSPQKFHSTDRTGRASRSRPKTVPGSSDSNAHDDSLSSSDEDEEIQRLNERRAMLLRSGPSNSPSATSSSPYARDFHKPQHAKSKSSTDFEFLARRGHPSQTGSSSQTHASNGDGNWRRSTVPNRPSALPALPSRELVRRQQQETQVGVQSLQKSLRKEAKSRDFHASHVAVALFEAERLVPLHFLKQFSSIGAQKQKVIQLVQDAVHNYTIGNMKEALRRWVMFVKSQCEAERAAAATEIQRIIKGKLARKEYAHVSERHKIAREKEAKRQMRLAEKRRKVEDRAAAQVQRRARGVLARARVTRLNFLRQAACTIQRFWTTHTAWVGAIRKLKKLKVERESATRIQSMARRRLAVKRVERVRAFHLRMRENRHLLNRTFVVERYFQEQGAAMAISQWFKRRLHSKKEWRFVGHRAAKIAQALVRGHLTRVRHGGAVRDAIAIAQLKHFLSRKGGNSALTKWSAIQIQCWVRTMWACRELKTRHQAHKVAEAAREAKRQQFLSKYNEGLDKVAQAFRDAGRTLFSGLMVKEQAAARLVQAHWRGRVGRRNVKQQRLVLGKLHRVARKRAVRILAARFFRPALQRLRKRRAMERAAVVQLQRFVRRKFGFLNSAVFDTAKTQVALWLQGQHRVSKARARAANRRAIRDSDRLKIVKCQSCVRMFVATLVVRRLREHRRFVHDELRSCGRDRVLLTHQRLMDRVALASAATALELAREQDEADAAREAQKKKGQLQKGGHSPRSPRSRTDSDPLSPRVGTPSDGSRRKRKNKSEVTLDSLREWASRFAPLPPLPEGRKRRSRKYGANGALQRFYGVVADAGDVKKSKAAKHVPTAGTNSVQGETTNQIGNLAERDQEPEDPWRLKGAAWTKFLRSVPGFLQKPKKGSGNPTKAKTSVIVDAPNDGQTGTIGTDQTGDAGSARTEMEKGSPAVSGPVDHRKGTHAQTSNTGNAIGGHKNHCPTQSASGDSDATPSRPAIDFLAPTKKPLPKTTLSTTHADIIFSKIKRRDKRGLDAAGFVAALQLFANQRYPKDCLPSFRGVEGDRGRLLKVLDEAFQHFPGADAQVVEHLSSKATKQLHAASWAIQRVFRNQHTYVMIEKALVVAETCKEEKIKSLAATRLQYFWRYVNARVNVARGLAKSVYEKYIDPKTQVPYWHNPRSGTTVWVKPTTLGSEDVEVKVAAVDPEQEYLLSCCTCAKNVAVVQCYECQDCYCAACFKARHVSAAKAGHRALELDVCPECELQQATHRCLDTCQDDYCETCFLNIHRAGALLKHKSLLLIEACDVCKVRIARVSCDYDSRFFCRDCVAEETKSLDLGQTYELPVVPVLKSGVSKALKRRIARRAEHAAPMGDFREPAQHYHSHAAIQGPQEGSDLYDQNAHEHAGEATAATGSADPYAEVDGQVNDSQTQWASQEDEYNPQVYAATSSTGQQTVSYDTAAIAEGSKQYAATAAGSQESPQTSWETFFTDDGTPYYYNHGTGETQWEAPE